MMLSAPELGWLVVVCCMVLGITFCLGVCLALWCRKVSGGRQISPVAMLDPLSSKKSKAPLDASMLLPTVTRSEFGSEPRSLSSTVTPISSLSQPYWSVGKAPPPHWSTGHPKSRTHLTPEYEPNDQDVYLPLPRPLHDLPPKYATVYTPMASMQDSEMRDRMAQLTAHWERSRHSIVDTTSPAVPGTLTYRQQPRLDLPDSGGSDSGGRRKISPGYGTDKTSMLSEGQGLPPIDRRRRSGSIKLTGKASPSSEEAPAEGVFDRDLTDMPRLEITEVGISGRRQLVSGFGYSEPEVLNPPCKDDEDSAALQSEYQTVRGRKRQKGRKSKKEREEAEQECIDSRSPILGGARQKSKYGADRSTDMTLSTGVSIGQIPLITSSIGRSRSRGSSRRRGRSRDSSRRRISRERSLKSSPGSEDIIKNLGIASELSDQKVSDLIATRYKDSSDPSSLSDATGKSRERFSDGQASADFISEDCIGSLGGLELQLKYQAKQQQLVMIIGKAIHLPARFQSPDSQLYVKILIGGSIRYTTPTVPGTQNPEFYFTLVHRVASIKLNKTNIRLSVCQLDPRQRRVVVGFATVQPIDLWPILHVATSPLTHNLATRHLMLPLHDSTPQHQVDCGGNITLGLIWEEQCGTITISCVTLQDIRIIDVIDTGNSLVYLKATVYRGRELLCWRRSQPVLLNRQRTHVVNQMQLKIQQQDDLSPSPTSEGYKLPGKLLGRMREGNVKGRTEKTKESVSEGGSDIQDDDKSTATSKSWLGPDETDRTSNVPASTQRIFHPVPEIRVHSYSQDKTTENVTDVVESGEEKRSSPEEIHERRSKLHLPVPKEYDSDSSGDESSTYKPYSDDSEKLLALTKKEKRRPSGDKQYKAGETQSSKPQKGHKLEKKGADDTLETDDRLSEGNETSPTDYSEKISDRTLDEENKQKHKDHDDKEEFKDSKQLLTSSTEGTGSQEEASGKNVRSRPPLQCQVSTEDESQGDAILLVLSLRLKTIKRSGRCILGTVELGDNAATPEGRSHWRRSSASTIVSAAGTHALTHQ